MKITELPTSFPFPHRGKSIYSGAFLLVLLSGCCFLASCSGEDSGSLPAPNNSVPIGIRSMQLDAEIVTRSTDVTTEGEKIRIFRTTANDYQPLYDIEYKYRASDTPSWNPTVPEENIYVDNRQATIIGVYVPSGNDAVNFVTESTVTSTKLTADAFNEDKLWYFDKQADINNSKAQLAFKMTPAYSRIKLSIQRHATNYVSGNCVITEMNLKSNNAFYKDNAIDISTGLLVGNPTNGGWTYPLNIGSIVAGSTNTSYDVLVPPQPVTGNLTIALTIDGNTRSVNIPATNFTSNALASGKQYTIELLITDSEIIPGGNVSITDYATDSSTITNNDPKEL